MVKQITISPGIIHFSQNLLVDWINKRLSINDRYNSFLRVAELAMKLSLDRDIKCSWKDLDDLKKVHLDIISDEEQLRLTNFGDYGYFPDGVYGGVSPLEYKEYLKKRI